MNNVQIIGRLATEPQFSYSVGGLEITNMFVIVEKDLSKEKKEKNRSEGKQTNDCIPVATFGASATNAAKYLVKGSKVAVNGTLVSSSYVKDGETRYSIKVNATSIEYLGSPKTPTDDENIPF